MCEESERKIKAFVSGIEKELKKQLSQSISDNTEAFRLLSNMVQDAVGKQGSKDIENYVQNQVPMQVEKDEAQQQRWHP